MPLFQKYIDRNILISKKINVDDMISNIMQANNHKSNLEVCEPVTKLQLLFYL